MNFGMKPFILTFAHVSGPDARVGLSQKPLKVVLIGPLQRHLTHGDRSLCLRSQRTLILPAALQKRIMSTVAFALK